MSCGYEQGKVGRHLGIRGVVVLMLMVVAATGQAGTREQAKRIYDRLTGVQPTADDLNTMENALKNPSGGAVAAAFIAMQKPTFYNTTLKNWVTPWTNEDSSPYADLNDFTATIIGMIRDDTTDTGGVNTKPFTDVLSADVVYLSPLTESTYSMSNNKHYLAMQSGRIDLSKAANLDARSQSEKSNGTLTTEQTAGIMTTQAFAAAFVRDGTNRRAIRYTFKNFLCRDIEEVADISRPTDRIRQDVSRSPGGDSTIFLNQCVGCHAGMDPLAQAFARYDYKLISLIQGDGPQLVISPQGKVQPKNHINANNFPHGYFITNDHWDNYWRLGNNANLGWDTSLPSGGDGIKSLGKELAASKAFATCQVQKAFKLTCLRDPAPSNSPNPDFANDQIEVQRISNVFEQSNYSMKRVLAETAAYCMGK